MVAEELDGDVSTGVGQLQSKTVANVHVGQHASSSAVAPDVDISRFGAGLFTRFDPKGRLALPPTRTNTQVHTDVQAFYLKSRR